MNSLTFRYTVFDDRVLPRTPLEKLMQYVVKEPYLLPWNNPKHSKIQNAGRPRKLWMRNRELCHAVGVAGWAAPQRQRHPGSCQQPSTQAPMPTASLQRRRAERDAGLELTLPPPPTWRDPATLPPLTPLGPQWPPSPGHPSSLPSQAPPTSYGAHFTLVFADSTSCHSGLNLNFTCSGGLLWPSNLQEPPGTLSRHGVSS